MALVNHAKKEINAKIVFFGPAGSGKSTALTYVYSRIKPSLRGEFRSFPAGSDNLLFFDFSPFEVPLSNGYHLRLHVYTLTGLVTNPATWKMTLKGADGIMITINPAAEQMDIAMESVSQLREYLSGYGVGLHETPAVLLLNSFTGEYPLENVTPTAAALDLALLKTCRVNAACGEGMLEALTTLSRQVLDKVSTWETPAHANIVCEVRSAEDEAFERYQPSAPDETSEVNILPKAVLPSPEHESEVRTIRIPLKITQGNTPQTLVVTIKLGME
jgi:signal recognition particle receptor subunit beta